MTFDFRANQVRLNKIISSGSIPILIYPSSSATDLQGNKNFPDPGSDVFLFVSGSSTAKTAFGGDIVVSGSITGSIHKTIGNKDFLTSGPNITLNYNADGQWEITGAVGIAGISGSVITTDATPTLILSHSLEANSVTSINFLVLADKDNNTERASFRRTILAYRSGSSNAVIEGNVQASLTDTYSLNASTWDVGIDVSGSDIRLFVTGAASNIISWSARGDFGQSTSTYSYVTASVTASNSYPGGEDTQVQFNSGSTFSGSANFTYNYNTNNLALIGSFGNGYNVLASGSYSHAEGLNSFAGSDYSHAEGDSTRTSLEGFLVDSVSADVLTLNSTYGDISTVFLDGSQLFLSDGFASIVEFATIASCSFDGSNTFVTASISPNPGINFLTLQPFDINPAGADQILATGVAAHAEGTTTVAIQGGSHAEGTGTIAVGINSHAEGAQTKAKGNYSHAEGINTIASGSFSHAEGEATIASGDYSHAEGGATTASSFYSHAEGGYTTASGQYSHAEGGFAVAFGDFSHAGGFNTIASGSGQTVFGKFNEQNNTDSLFVIGDGFDDLNRHDVLRVNSGSVEITGSLIAEQITGSLSGTVGGLPFLIAGSNVTVDYNSLGQWAVSASVPSIDLSWVDVSVTNVVTVTGSFNALHLSASSGAEVTGSLIAEQITGSISGTVGGLPFLVNGGNMTDVYYNAFTGQWEITGSAPVDLSWVDVSVFDVVRVTGSFDAVHLSSSNGLEVTGSFTQGAAGLIASGQYSHAQGQGTAATGDYSHAEGYLTITSGSYSHAEGQSTTTFGDSSHAEGQGTVASGSYSHAEGYQNITSGSYSHAEGQETTTVGFAAHAEGRNTTAFGDYSHAEGYNTLASGSYSHAEGNSTKTFGDYSHAEGQGTIASGSYSHAGGIGTIASGSGQTVVGSYNEQNNATSLFVVGDGYDDSSRHDVLRVNSGSVEITGSLTTIGSFSTEHLSASSGAEITGSLIVNGFNITPLWNHATTSVAAPNTLLSGSLLTDAMPAAGIGKFDLNIIATSTDEANFASWTTIVNITSSNAFGIGLLPPNGIDFVSSGPAASSWDININNDASIAVTGSTDTTYWYAQLTKKMILSSSGQVIY